jgi:hypothetical protein
LSNSPISPKKSPRWKRQHHVNIAAACLLTTTCLLDDIERIGVVQLAKNYRAGSELLGDEQGCQSGHGLGFEVLEEDDFTQYIGKGRHE